MNWLFLAVLPLSQAIFFELKEDQCFKEYVVQDQEFWSNYVISGKGDQNVLVQVFSPDKVVLYKSSPKSRQGTFNYVATQSGYYELCFSLLDKQPKTVSINFSSEVQEDWATEGEIEPLRNNLKHLSRNLDTVFRNINFYERREKIHRDLTERTCDRVLWSGVFKILVLCGISFTQVIMLTKFFAKTSQSI